MGDHARRGAGRRPVPAERPAPEPGGADQRPSAVRPGGRLPRRHEDPDHPRLLPVAAAPLSAGGAARPAFRGDGRPHRRRPADRVARPGAARRADGSRQRAGPGHGPADRRPERGGFRRPAGRTGQRARAHPTAVRAAGRPGRCRRGGSPHARRRARHQRGVADRRRLRRRVGRWDDAARGLPRPVHRQRRRSGARHRHPALAGRRPHRADPRLSGLSAALPDRRRHAAQNPDHQEGRRRQPGGARRLAGRGRTAGRGRRPDQGGGGGGVHRRPADAGAGDAGDLPRPQGGARAAGLRRFDPDRDGAAARAGRRRGGALGALQAGRRSRPHPDRRGAGHQPRPVGHRVGHRGGVLRRAGRARRRRRPHRFRGGGRETVDLQLPARRPRRIRQDAPPFPGARRIVGTGLGGGGSRHLLPLHRRRAGGGGRGFRHRRRPRRGGLRRFAGDPSPPLPARAGWAGGAVAAGQARRGARHPGLGAAGGA